jgi:hypothetical protein
MYGRELRGFHQAYYHGAYILCKEDRLASTYGRQIGLEEKGQVMTRRR